MTDVFNVTANYNQTSYVSGQTIVIAIAGADVLTSGGGDRKHFAR